MDASKSVGSVSPSFAGKAARVVGIIVGACMVFLLTLSVWNLAVTRWQHARYPVPGDFYSIDGRRMHLYCTGTGSPVIVIEAGLGSSWLGWQTVQPKLSALTRVCTYDRSGQGWSEPRLGLRDAEAIAQQLHALLNQAGVQRPMVLLGHSVGGLYVREYAWEFPSEVAAVALIDSSSPHQIDELPGWRTGYETDLRNDARDLPWQKLRDWSGWERLMGRCHDTPEKGLENLAGQYNAQMCRPEYEGADLGELAGFEAAGKQAARLASFGKVPLLIISQDPDLRKKGMTSNAVAGRPVWAREQEALKSLSPLSWRVIARGSGHGIQNDRPDLVLAEVARLLSYLRGGPAPAFGSTTVE